MKHHKSKVLAALVFGMLGANLSMCISACHGSIGPGPATPVAPISPDVTEASPSPLQTAGTPALPIELSSDDITIASERVEQWIKTTKVLSERFRYGGVTRESQQDRGRLFDGRPLEWRVLDDDSEPYSPRAFSSPDAGVTSGTHWDGGGRVLDSGASVGERFLDGEDETIVTLRRFFQRDGGVTQWSRGVKDVDASADFLGHSFRDGGALAANKAVYLLKLVSIDPIDDDDDYNKLTQSFYKLTEVSLEEKIFYKYIHAMNIPPEQAALEIRGHCFDVRLGARANGAITRSSFQCMAATESGRVAAEKIDRYIDQIAVTRPGRVSRSQILAQVIWDQARSKYEKTGKVQVVSSNEPGYLQFNVNELRGVVVASERHWEKLQISLVWYREHATWTFRCFADGQYGPGLSPPGARGYYDLEPRYAKDLSDYARAFLNGIIVSLSP